MTIHDYRKVILLLLIVALLITFTVSLQKAESQDAQFMAEQDAYAMAALLYEEGKYEDALPLTSVLLQQKQKTELVYSLHGQILVEMKRFVEAKESFEKALSMNPHLVEDSYFLYHLGIALKENKNFAEAIKVFKTCLALEEAEENENSSGELIELVNELLNDLKS